MTARAMSAGQVAEALGCSSRSVLNMIGRVYAKFSPNHLRKAASSLDVGSIAPMANTNGLAK